MYVNLASATKLHRATQINTDIGANGLMKLYTGSAPANPDLAATGTLLVSLPLSATAAVASLAVQAGTITAPGSLGTNGTYALTFTGGAGSGAAGSFIVAANSLSAIVISDPGFGYTSAPTLSGFTTAGLSSAAATAIMTGMLTFNAITTATAVGTGVAGYARITKSDGSTAIIDLDVGTTNSFSVITANTMITSGGSVACSAQVLIEG